MRLEMVGREGTTRVCVLHYPFSSTVPVKLDPSWRYLMDPVIGPTETPLLQKVMDRG